MSELDGVVVVVTGAGRGIGRAEAIALASHGARVVVNDHGSATDGEGNDSAPADEVVEEISRAGGIAIADYADVADWRSAERMIQTAVDSFGRLDILLNNAGITRHGPTWELTESDWDSVIRVNLKGTFCPTRAAIVHWRGQERLPGPGPGPMIINTSSEVGAYGQAGKLSYAAAKAGVIAMTLSLARELEALGVRVNCVAPVADTRLFGLGTDGFVESPQVTSDGSVGTDQQGALSAANVAALVLWLCSEEASAVNGKVIKVHGGLIELLAGWRVVSEIRNSEPWTLESIAQRVDGLFEDVPKEIEQYPIDLVGQLRRSGFGQVTSKGVL